MSIKQRTTYKNGSAGVEEVVNNTKKTLWVRPEDMAEIERNLHIVKIALDQTVKEMKTMDILDYAQRIEKESNPLVKVLKDVKAMRKGLTPKQGGKND